MRNRLSASFKKSVKNYQLTAKEISIIRKLDSYSKIQDFIDYKLTYHHEDTCRSFRRVVRDSKANCSEGVFFAAFVSFCHGAKPLIVDLRATKDDDHLLHVFRQDGKWGAIAQSNYTGLKWREPVFGSVRELVLSYVDFYFDLRGRKSLRYYTKPINLNRYGKAWAISEKDLFFITDKINSYRANRLLTRGQILNLRNTNKDLKKAGELAMV
ncbi:hypothetical protein J4475_04155 [Candidatus Woesearchaeota archaeon]|nr:hypothetical protein [Candidatus Woesearchaeota archaeon]